ncbi:hypothetical protein M9Y10_040830 [Tritrichomonas musculus]|uniref:KxDL domain-containing protein n=1 Tax=Tritrichomonas musculus TaxID=1915356 RepID=A0ABR2K2Q6_9EUKA
MSQNSYTPTEESTQITSNNEYESVFEEEEEEFLEDNIERITRKYRFEDPRDQIILDNQRKIQRMQKAFKQAATEMRAELADICDQSSKLQFAMLDRILQLKEKIKEIKERNAFCRRGYTYTNVKVKRKRIKKKSKTKKTITSQPRVPEVAYVESGESF